MYKLSIAGVDPYMAGIAYDITRLRILQSIHCRAYASVCCRRMRQAHAEVTIYAHDKSRTVRPVCKACSAIYILIANELLCIFCYLFTCAAAIT